MKKTLPRRIGLGVLRAALGIFLLFIFVGPLWSLLTTALSAVPIRSGELLLLPKDFTFNNFVRAWQEFGVSRYFFNSVVIAGIALSLQVLVSTLAAYALARKRFVGAAVVTLLILSTMMMPEAVIAIPLYLTLSDLPLFHLNLLNTYAGMTLPLVGWAFSIFILTEFMRDVPIELEESARIDGASDITIFVYIILPLILPALATVTVFGFIMIWDQYLLPLIVANDNAMFTLPIALASIRGDNSVTPAIFLAAAVITMIPSIAVYLSLQRYFERGLTAGAVKG